MTRTTSIALAALLLSATPHRAAAQAAASDPRLDQRVSISFQNARAVEVIAAMAKVAVGESGRKWVLYFRHEDLLPVTITLTNVKLRTALDAVCQTAQCAWEGGTDGIIRIRRAEEPVSPVPQTVSLELKQVPLLLASQALAAALNVTLVAETAVPDQLSNWNLSEAKTAGVLRLMSDICGCSYVLDEQARTLRIVAAPPGQVPRTFRWNRQD